VNLRREVTDALVAEGFARGRFMHRKPLDDGWSLLVDTGAVGKATDIAPYTGLQYTPVEKLLQELCGLSPSEGAGTVGANAGYILDGVYRSWMPRPQAPVAVAEVLDTIHAALDRLMAYQSLDRLPAAWAELPDTRFDPACAYRQVIVQFLRNDRAGIDRELAAAQEVYCVRDDEICADFQAFRERLLFRLSG